MKIFSILGIAAFVLLLRAALLPVWPIPIPNIHDEFCYLLEADTFAHGRLTNPQHPMWPFFESIYIIPQPTYTAKYPPAQSLVMAAGQAIGSDPWWGVWLSAGVLAGALCWALQGWFPWKWALLGAAFSIQLCFYSYWMNSYWGGAVAAIGGALAMGAWRRIAQGRNHIRNGIILGVAAVILVLSRPFEGSLLMVPLLLTLPRRKAALLPIWIPIVACGVLGAGWLGYYQYRVTGNPLRMPYNEYEERYETVPQFNFLPLRNKPVEYAHVDQQWVDRGWQMAHYTDSRSWRFLWIRPDDWYQTLKTLLGNRLLIIPLICFAPWYLRSRKIRFPAILTALIVAATFVEVPHFSHYVAPFLPAMLILTVQSIRFGWHRIGRVYMLVFLIAVFAGSAWTDASQIARNKTPDRFMSKVWKRTRTADQLGEGRHVVFVRYTQYRSPHEEWVYNGADIDSQDIIWAQDMGDDENRKLIAYYPGRKFWMFQPDESSDIYTPYGN